MTLIEAILNAGSVAGLISIFLEIHQGRRNRPSLALIFEGYQTINFQDRQHPHYCEARFQGIIRNASLTPNTIVRLYLVVWDKEKLNHPKRLGFGIKSMQDLATESRLALPLRMEGRDGRHVEILFDVQLTDSRGTPSYDGELLLMPLDSNRPRHQIIFEDAAGNYFDESGRLLSRDLMNLYTTLPNYQGRARLGQYNRIASSWILWKLAILRSYFGFYT